MKFGELKIGDKFECYGDRHLNYSYPKICKCIKVKDDVGQEIDSMSFFMNPSDEVFTND